MGQHRIAIRLACALLVGGLIWPGAPASAAEVSAQAQAAHPADKHHLWGRLVICRRLKIGL